MPNDKYWQERMEALENANYQKGRNYTANVEKQFRMAQKNIEDKINYWYARMAENNEVTMQGAKRLLRADELEEFKWSVEEYIKKGESLQYSDKWAKQLENASAKVHISRLEALKMQMQQECEVLYGNMADGLDDTLRDMYTNSYYHTAYEMMKGHGVGWAFNRLDNRRIETAINTLWTNDGKRFSDRVWSNKDKLVNELNTVLTQNIIRGESPQRAIQQLSHRLKVSRSNAGRLIMTESAFIHSQAQRDCYKELDVERFQFVATLDSRTSEVCQAMDGVIIDMADYKIGLNVPPLHCYCRSCVIPHYEDNVGMRAARGEDGKTYLVPSDMTYKDWKKSFVDGDVSELKEITQDDIIKLDKEMEDLKQQFSNITEGYSYDEWFKDFDTIEDGYGDITDADMPNVYKLKAIHTKLKDLMQKKAQWKKLLAKNEPTEAYKNIKKVVEKNKVDFREVQTLKDKLTDAEIIDRLAGGDMTGGSCSSLAFSYIGNKNGLDVIDFRGGKSREVFSFDKTIQEFTKLDGVKGSITMVQKEISDTMDLIKNLEHGKEYYLAVGRHAAIIRNTENGVEYLELQSKIQNGWTSFENNRYGSMYNTLFKRFGCRKTVDKIKLGIGKPIVIKKPVVLMEVDSFKGNDEFKEILGYINTATDKQKKGVLGDVK